MRRLQPGARSGAGASWPGCNQGGAVTVAVDWMSLVYIFKISVAARLKLPQGRDGAVLHVVLISRGGV